MKKLIWLLALCVGLSLSALAQYGGSSSSGTSASQGSSSSSTDQATTSKKSKKNKEEGAEKAGKEHTVTGCLSGPNDEGVYVLTNGRYKKGLEVGGNDELKNHVGHEVKLTGTWASESEIGAKESATAAKEGKSEAKEKHMKVAKIDHIADTCTSKASKGKSKKEKGSSSTSTPPSM
ncbi:MAG TPA: hypothetical protein VE994_17875 [Terriglobales bacterium]|nr:hypothetical protein [Terriglobales bacterium]